MSRRTFTILQTVALLCSLFILIVPAVVRFPAAIAVQNKATLCLSARSGCEGNGGIELAGYVRKATRIPKQSSNTKTTQLACSPNPAQTLAYEQQLRDTLAATNTQVDAVRAQALSDGEPYQTFDAQLNALFAAYDTSVQNLYATYVAGLHGCLAGVQPPQLFDMFTP